MSLSTIQSSINRIQNELANLHKKLSDEKQKEAAATLKATRAQESISRTKSQTTIKSKLSEISRCQTDIARSGKNQADIQKKITDKSKDLIRYQQQLAKEQEAERKKQDSLYKRLEQDRQKEHDDMIRALQAQIASPTSVLSSPSAAEGETFDLFISHASEDKEEFVKPLVIALQNEGVEVWYDEFTLKVGDRLRRSIDNGLRKSTYGVIVLSSSFFRKNWTQYELDSLVAQEMATGNKRILPIWHKVSRDEIMQFSPNLVDIVGLDSTRSTIKEIAKDLASLVK